MSTETIELQALAGEHLLDAVDFSTEDVPRWYDASDFEHCQVMRFRLDGKVYTAIEDPSDGYRSSMRELIVSNAEMKNTFAPVRVIGRHRTEEDEFGLKGDVLELIDATTGHVVIEVGTEKAYDYYPWFVAAFHPEAMAINQGQDAEAR